MSAEEPIDNPVPEPVLEPNPDGERVPRVRADKWLWAARFYKTRALANQAIAGGKVHINGARAKPSRFLDLGDEMTLRKGDWEITIKVAVLSTRRGPPERAREMYQETPRSESAREERQEKRRDEHAAAPDYGNRPDKKGRRQLLRMHLRRR